MPRKPREKSATGIYHVIVRGIDRQDIFHEADDFQKYLETAKRLSLERGVSVLGYCLLTNHVHLLLKEDNGDLSAFMKRLGVGYAYWYNRKYERIGHVFQDRFKSECIEDDAYLLTVIRYIHQNPVKASITGKPEDYQWSSCAAYYAAGRNTAKFPDTGLILGILHQEKKKAIAALRKFTQESNEDHCLESEATKRISESAAYEIIKQTIQDQPVTALQTMDQDARNLILRRLRNDGLSLRQIGRLTGLPFHIVRKA